MAPVDEIPEVFAVIKPPPELNVNVDVLPSKRLVPTSNVLPLFTVKLITVEIVPPDFEYVCVPDFAKLKFPAPAPAFVNVPLVIVKFPERLIVPALLACLKISNVPVDNEKSPPMANEQLPVVLEPNGAKYPPAIDRLPEMVEAKVLELVNNKQEDELGVAPVDCTVKLPFTVERPPKLNVLDCDGQFQRM